MRLGVQAPPLAVDAVTLNAEIFFASQYCVRGFAHVSAPLPLGEPQLSKHEESSKNLVCGVEHVTPSGAEQLHEHWAACASGSESPS